MLMQIDGTFIVAFISFLVFLILIKLILFRPITDIIEKRQAYLEKNELTKAQTSDKIVQLKQEKENKLNIARQNANELYTSEVEKYKKEIDYAITSSQDEAKKTLEINKNKLLDESRLAKSEAKEEIVQIAKLIASKILKEDIEIKDNDNKIEEYLGIS